MNKRKLPVCVLLAAALALQTSCEIEGGIIGYITGKVPETEEIVPEEPVYSEPVPANLAADYDWAVNNAPDFTVSNAGELISAAYWVNHISDGKQKVTITLTQDIDLSDYLWEPMGQPQGTRFAGEIDGGGHAISGLTIQNAYQDTGFVGYATFLNVHDLVFTEADVSGRENTGIICGEMYGEMTWRNVHVFGSITTDAANDYGAMGGRTPDLEFDACYADVTVNGEGFSYLTWQQYADEHNVHENDYTLEYNSDGSITRSRPDTEAENLQWVICRNGNRVLGRGCEDEYTIEPNTFDIVGTVSGIYSVYLEAFYGNGYLRCSNTVEYESVPKEWTDSGMGEEYPLYLKDPYEIETDPDMPFRLGSHDGYTWPEELSDLSWILVADGVERLRKPFTEGEEVNTHILMQEAKKKSADLETGDHNVFIFVAGTEENGSELRISNIYAFSYHGHNSESAAEEGVTPTVYVDGIDTGGAPEDYTATLAADDLDNEEEFLSGMIIVGPEGHAWRAEPARTGGKYSYGDREGDTAAFHIVTDQSGHMFCIDKDPSYESGHNVKWVMLFNGNEELTADYFDDPAAVQQGAFVPFTVKGPKEGVYSVYVIDEVNGVKERISNVLEFRIV